MTFTDLMLAVTVGNIVSMVLISLTNFYIDKYSESKRREKLEAILDKITFLDDEEPSSKKTVKKTVKPKTPKKNG